MLRSRKLGLFGLDSEFEAVSEDDDADEFRERMVVERESSVWLSPNGEASCSVSRMLLSDVFFSRVGVPGRDSSVFLTNESHPVETMVEIMKNVLIFSFCK